MRGRASRPIALAAVVPTLLALAACGGQDRMPDAANRETAGGDAGEMRRAELPAGTERTERRTREEAGEEARTVPAGTVMTVRLEETVSTRTHEAGDEFSARVTHPVRSDDRRILVPEGAEVTGVVQEAERSEGPDDEALLALRLESVEVNGESYPLTATIQNAEPERSEGDSGAETAAKIAIGTAAGALIGQVLGEDTESTRGGAAAGAVAGTVIALASRGGDATLARGSELRVQLNEPVQLGP